MVGISLAIYRGQKGLSLGNSEKKSEPRGPKDWKNSRFRSGIETFKRPISDWNFQSRLKFSSEIENNAPAVGNYQGRDWKFQARLKLSIEIEIFKPGLVAWKFQSRSEILNFFNLWVTQYKNLAHRNRSDFCDFRSRANREVQTVNWEAGKEGAVERGVKSSLKRMDWKFHAINRDWIFSIAGPSGKRASRGLPSFRWRSPKGPFRTKITTTIVKIVNYYAVVFLLRPPNLLHRGPFFERKNVCNSQENGVRTRCGAISKSPRRTKNTTRSKCTTRSIFSTAGSFGQKGTPGRGRDRKCHDRASLSRPLVLSLGRLTSLTSFPLFCTSEDINGRGGGGGASDKMGLEGKGTDLSWHFLTFFFPSPFWRPLLTFTDSFQRNSHGPLTASPLDWHWSVDFSGPISLDTAILLLRYPISRDMG